MAWWRRIQVHSGSPHLVVPELRSHKVVACGAAHPAQVVIRHLNPLMCNRSQEVQDKSQYIVKGLWRQLDTPVQAAPRCWNTTGIPLVHDCLPAPGDLPDTILMLNPTPLPDHNCSKSFVLRTQQCVFAQLQICAPGVRIPIWQLRAFYLLSPSPSQQYCFVFTDLRVRKIRNEASSCPGIIFRTLRFFYVASSCLLRLHNSVTLFYWLESKEDWIRGL